MEKMSWTDRVKLEEALQSVKDERNILETIKRRKANWIGHIWNRDSLQKYVIGGEMEGGQKRRENQEEDVNSSCMT